MAMEQVSLCAAADLGPGGMRRFEPAGADPILLVNIDGAFHAVDDECTHAIASLAEGRLEGSTLFCPMHGGSFDACSGKALSLPCKQALRVYPVQVVDGQICITLD
jgi:nitrite reductase/ring-hydroxylating ferredoxin subunit